MGGERIDLSFFRDMAERSTDLIGISTIDGELLYMNPAGQRWLKRSAEELVGIPIYEIHSPAHRQRLHDAILHVLEYGVWNGETALINGEGLEVVGAQTIVVHRDETGHPLFYSTVIRDLSEMRSLEAQLQQARRLEAVGQLAGGVAHDFNNLLTVISNCVRLSQASVEEGTRAARNLEMARDAADRAAALCRQLLGFAQKQIIQPKTTQLNEVISGFSDFIARVIGENIRLELDLEAALYLICADASQLDQILANLAVNARDAMPDGGLLVISTENVPMGDARLEPLPLPTSDYILLKVSDTGEGMSKEVQERAIEPFFTTKGQGKGTGLGLATVYGAVTQNGGTLQIESEVGYGTRICIYWPRSYEAESELEAAPESSRLSGEGRILLVEDEAMVLELTASILRDAGYEVMAASSPSQALQWISGQGEHFDLILTDIVMPDMTGPQLVERIEKLGLDVPVIYMSGYTHEAIDAGGVLQEGVNFLLKPFSVAQLLRALRRGLRKSSTRPRRPQVAE